MKKFNYKYADDSFTQSYLDIPEALKANNKGRHTVYKLSAPDGRSYIGQTGNTLPRRCQRGKNYKRNPELTADIQRYGWDNFSLEILRENVSGEYADIIERLAIAHYNAMTPNGYNKERGGIRGHNSKQAKPVFQLDKNTGEIIALWDSRSTASRALHIRHQKIAKATTDKRHSAGGFAWKNATPEAIAEWNQQQKAKCTSQEDGGN